MVEVLGVAVHELGQIGGGVLGMFIGEDLKERMHNRAGEDDRTSSSVTQDADKNMNTLSGSPPPPPAKTAQDIQRELESAKQREEERNKEWINSIIDKQTAAEKVLSQEQRLERPWNKKPPKPPVRPPRPDRMFPNLDESRLNMGDTLKASDERAKESADNQPINNQKRQRSL